MVKYLSQNLETGPQRVGAYLGAELKASGLKCQDGYGAILGWGAGVILCSSLCKLTDTHRNRQDRAESPRRWDPTIPEDRALITIAGPEKGLLCPPSSIGGDNRASGGA